MHSKICTKIAKMSKTPFNNCCLIDQFKPMGVVDTFQLDQRNSPEDCLAAEESTTDRAYNIVRAAQLSLALITNLLLIKLVLCYKRSPITLHSNLLLLLISVLICYAFLSWSFIIMNSRNFVLALSYSDPCDCLSPVWLVYVVRMPFYMYIAGSPMLHFAIMVERVRATLFVRNYEKEGRKFGIGIFIAVSLLTLSFCAFVFVTSQMDAQLTGKPMVYFTLTSSKRNSVQLTYVHYFFLFLVICISIADYFLIRMNSKLKSKFSNKVQDYSLSRNYQTNENILTMRIIFPLDFSYSIVFSVFNLLSYYIRSKREEVGQIAYMKTYDAFIVLLLAHAIVTLAVYQYFMRRKAKMHTKFGLNAKEQTNAYFDQLEQQWK